MVLVYGCNAILIANEEEEEFWLAEKGNRRIGPIATRES